MTRDFVVKVKGGGWIRRDMGHTDDILCAGVWPEDQARAIVDSKRSLSVISAHDAWTHWYEHHGPETFDGSMMDWVAWFLNSQFYEQIHLELPMLLPSPDRLHAALKERRKRIEGMH